MNTTNLIRQALLKYPLIFGNRFDVLSHVLLDTGNGYKWENGEIDAVGDNKPITIKEAIHSYVNNAEDLIYKFAINDNIPQDSRKDICKRIIEIQFKYLHKYINMAYNIDERINDMSVENSVKLSDNVTHNFIKQYVSEYSLINNIPNDVTYDWKQCISDFFKILMKHPEYIEDGCFETLDKIKENLKALNIYE